MEKISGSKILYKRVNLAIFLGTLLLMIIPEFYLKSGIGVIVTNALICITIYFFLMLNVWGLVDEVNDCGDYFIFRKGDYTQSVFLKEIMEIDSSARTYPTRITVYTKRRGQIGSELNYTPRWGEQLSVHAIARELRERVMNAKKPNNTLNRDHKTAARFSAAP